MKQTAKIYLFWEKYRWEEIGRWIPLYFKADDSDSRVFVKELDFEFDAPEEYDPRQQQIEALRKEQNVIQADAYAKCIVIDERIQSLQAIEFKQPLAAESATEVGQ